ncbi:hypothetical protein ACOI1C_12155 [Bacillus sp. DJP31]|uniref:hypothetical protein n=1 Tax=Bacillus sp. DJP31 TaxID=3409789 RepID=UPI003BB52AD2
MWKSSGISFHPKAYIFHYQTSGTIIIGSSNLSRSALTSGIEWNVLLSESTNQDTFETATRLFIDTFYSNHTIPINNETIKSYQQKYDIFHKENPHLEKKMTELEELELMYSSNC